MTENEKYPAALETARVEHNADILPIIRVQETGPRHLPSALARHLQNVRAAKLLLKS